MSPSTPTPAPTAPPATPTTVKATIIWPQRSRQTVTTNGGSSVEVAALTSASSAVITFTGANTSGGDITIVAARPSGPTATTPTYTSTGTANPGTYPLTVKFYNLPLTSAGAIDPTAVVVATAQANTQILANGTLSATITTVGQIQSVVVTPGQVVALGATTPVAFTALGTPVNGQQVIIPVVPGVEQVTAANVDSTIPPVASIASGLLTAAYPGQTSVTVTVDNLTSLAVPITVVSNAVVAISPNPATVAVGGTVQLAASVTPAPNQAVVWSLGTDAATAASGATIDQTGLFTAVNRSGGPFTVIATSVYDKTKTATATVNVTSNVVIYPSDQSPGVTTETEAAIGANKTISLPVTVTGTTNMTVTYAVTDSTGAITTAGGSVTTAGVYTAPNVQGTFYVTATSVADTSKVVTFIIPVIPSVTISPGKTTISVDQSVTFFANVVGGNGSGVSYSVVEAGGGTITSAGVYTAPDTAGTYHVKATSTANPTETDTATVVVQSGSGIIIIN